MPVWTVHAPPVDRASDEPADDIVFIREGFSWGAFLFAPIWAIARGLWLTLVLWIAAMIVISLIDARFGGAAGWPLWLGFQLWFGLEARNLRRATLDRRGWEFLGVVDARSGKMAERRFFEKQRALFEPRSSGGDARALSAMATGATPPPLPFASSLPPIIGYSAGDTP